MVSGRLAPWRKEKAERALSSVNMVACGEVPSEQ
jgi:hypothetical protein